MSRDGGKQDWSWLPKMMPTVARKMADARAKVGNAHVNACWHRGVVLGEPGAFFAAEGALMIGMPTARQMIDWVDPAPGVGRPPAVLHLAELGDASGDGHAVA